MALAQDACTGRIFVLKTCVACTREHFWCYIWVDLHKPKASNIALACTGRMIFLKTCVSCRREPFSFFRSAHFLHSPVSAAQDEGFQINEQLPNITLACIPQGRHKTKAFKSTKSFLISLRLHSTRQRDRTES